MLSEITKGGASIRFGFPKSVDHTTATNARVINEMFSRWGIPENASREMGWNISGELCSGSATNSTDFDLFDYNPGISCDCTFPNSTCHITQINVYEMDARGPIPEGLWTLTYLTHLDLARNYLTDSLSSSIGNLTRMKIMYISTNALSGQIPPELGQLTDLRKLAFGTNNFNGSLLPSELGNLRRLEWLSFSSSGVVGDIPPTFANLQNLQLLVASDNGLTGRIPDFIGNWSQLQTLMLEGNSFNGSIPPSFSSLTLLRDLRISGLSYGTLDFIQGLKDQLDFLSLRNNRLSGSIPNDIGEYVNLTHLDLSFNNLSGPIPRELFNLSQLSFLSLGNNSLTGTLPDEINAAPRSRVIDLSYNKLSGTLPYWAVDPTILQVNILVNNFTLNNLGLNCLQRVFPCGRGSPRYSTFGINCGGPQITSSSQIVHEQENKTLGPATYFLSPDRRWAVSNVGQSDYGEKNDTESTPRQFNSTIASSTRRFTNTIDSGLFQTARLSAGSLRYYALALENGNYTVKLQFAELEIEDDPTFRSLGKRIFDIYIQVRVK